MYNFNLNLFQNWKCMTLCYVYSILFLFYKCKTIKMYMLMYTEQICHFYAHFYTYFFTFCTYTFQIYFVTILIFYI